MYFTVSQKIDARPPQQRAQSQQRQSPRTNHINKRPWRRVRRFSPRRFLNDATHAQHDCLASAPRSPSINWTQLMTSLPKPDLRSSARTPTYPSFAPRGARQVNETAPKTRAPAGRSAIGPPWGPCHTKTLRKRHNQRAPWAHGSGKSAGNLWENRPLLTGVLGYSEYIVRRMRALFPPAIPPRIAPSGFRAEFQLPFQSGVSRE